MQNLTRTEREVLYKKYVSCLKLTPEDANRKVKNFVKYLSELSMKLTKRKKTKEEISERFKREFENLCQSLDGWS